MGEESFSMLINVYLEYQHLDLTNWVQGNLYMKHLSISQDWTDTC